MQASHSCLFVFSGGVRAQADVAFDSMQGRALDWVGQRAVRDMILEREFVSVGVNRVANALDWGEDGLVAYGGHHMVAIYDPEVRHWW